MLAIKGALCIIVALSVFLSAEGDVEVISKNYDWDLLVFTQHWPATVCLEWMRKGSQHSCSFPSQKDAWTVHGIWPTKKGTIGPGFCNHSMHFNKTALDPIEKQLEQYWINIEKDTPLYDLWKHEWQKHGTCAAVLPSLDTETKYFAQGLRWLQLYSMSNILQSSGFVPNPKMSYKPTDIYDAVKKKVGKNPSMHCHIDTVTGISYLFEIRICFSKSMELIDCDGIKMSEDPSESYETLLHCDPSKLIAYTDIVPSVRRKSVLSDWPLIEIYKLVSWLQWFTF